MKTSQKFLIFFLILIQSFTLGYTTFSLCLVYAKTGAMPQSWYAFLNPMQVKSPAEIEEEQLQGAILYLDNTATWSKTAMEQYPQLQGLFEDMNHFEFDRLTVLWKTRLNQSVMINKLCQAAEESKKKGYNVTYAPHEKCYDMKETDSIVVLEYIQWISEDHKVKRSHRSRRHRSHRTMYIDEYEPL